MPRNKDLKRLVRARMKKTGEAYTAARARIIAKPTQNYAELAGMSDAVIKDKTGCTWDRWVSTLDRLGAAEMPHRDIARLVQEKFKTGDWWSQTVTVGYERIKGLRARGQRRDGTYELSKSRTFDVPVKTLFDAWANPTARKRWLDGAQVRVRTATPPKSMRLDWTDGSIIAIGFMPKGKSKSAVAVQHTKLREKETVNRLKEFWSERLDALGESLVDG
ncbi:MAG TPA: hypothetical protein VE110_12955 [Gemmatimonadaceae bacterium]|nr:hypothetical protein [Gemmatimonadaceae bacterium]